MQKFEVDEEVAVHYTDKSSLMPPFVLKIIEIILTSEADNDIIVLEDGTEYDSQGRSLTHNNKVITKLGLFV